MPVSVQPLGDNAITISFGDPINDTTYQQVLSLYNYIKSKNIAGVRDVIPAYVSLTIVYDMLEIKKVTEGSVYDYVHEIILQNLKQATNVKPVPVRTLHIPVCYHTSLGVDLISMSQQKQMAVEEIIYLHASSTYRVYMLGFLPGFAYMGLVNDKIAAPRKAVPGKNVLAGSVGIADSQTGIYPFDSPGGWNIIGQTPEPLFYPRLKQPCLFQPGDMVKFEPITLDQFNKLKQS
jgi:inhibitor of KinA